MITWRSCKHHVTLFAKDILNDVLVSADPLCYEARIKCQCLLSLDFTHPTETRYQGSGFSFQVGKDLHFHKYGKWMGKEKEWWRIWKPLLNLPAIRLHTAFLHVGAFLYKPSVELPSRPPLQAVLSRGVPIITSMWERENVPAVVMGRPRGIGTWKMYLFWNTSFTALPRPGNWLSPVRDRQGGGK